MAKPGGADISAGVSGPNLKMLGQDHSSFSAERSRHYHKAIAPTTVRHSELMMTKSTHQLNNPEDMDEKGHKF